MQKFMKNKKNIILISIIGGICIVYLLLCLFTQSEYFLKNTTINGIEVGNMTKDEAVKALNQQFQDDTPYLNLKLIVKDKEYQINVKDNVSFDAQSTVEDISKEISSSFLTRGYNYLFGSDFSIPVIIKDEKKLLETIQKSQILQYDTKEKTQYKIGENEITFTKGHDGEKTSQDDIIEKIHKALESYDFKEHIECSLVESKNDENEMKELHEKLSKAAKNATLDKNNDYKIVDSQVGVNYDLDESIKEFNNASQGESFTINATIIQPKISKEMLEKNLFKDVLGSYTTTVSGTAVRRNNVRLAGVKCNNVILLPGEEFSYNETVGERTVAGGFGAAGAYVNGETVDAIGGGICQSSSTIYNAVLLSNLEITERTNHSYVSSYVPIGRDATVSWGGPDFKFKNNQDYPIKLEVTYSNSRLNCKVYGTNVDHITVKITGERLSSTGYKTIYKDDPTLEEGKEKVLTSGYTGAKAQTYRHVYDANGKLISSQKEAYSVYKSRDKVVLRGTKKKEENTQPSDKSTTHDQTQSNPQNTNNQKKPSTNDKKKVTQ